MAPPEAPRSPTRRIELRGARLWQPGFVAFVAATVVSAELAVARFRLDLDLPPLLDRAFLASLALALLSPIAALALRPKSPDAIVLTAEHVEIPTHRGSRRRRRLLHRDVYSIERLEWGPLGMLAIGVRGRLVARVPIRWLVSPGDAARIEAGIRDRIGSLPDAAERLRGLDRCRSVWQAAGRGVPWLTLGWASSLLMVFVFEAAVGATGDPLRLLALGGLSPDRVAQGEMDRLFTSAFLHSSSLHLVMNAASLIVLGVMLERLLGWARFLIVLSFAQIAGTAFWAIWPNAVVAVGASAALYGIVGCWLFLHLGNREELPVFLRSPAWNWMLLLGLALWIEVGFSNAAHAAHLGGFAGGFAAGAAVVRSPLDQLGANRPRLLSVIAGAWVLVWASALGLGIQRAWGPLPEGRSTEIGRALLAAEEAERSREATPRPSGGRRSSRAPRRAPGRSGPGCARLRGAR